MQWLKSGCDPSLSSSPSPVNAGRDLRGQSTMSKIFNDVLAGLNEAVEYAKGNVTEAVIREIEPLDLCT